MRKRDPGFWASTKVQSIIRLAARGRLSWETATERVNKLTPRLPALPVGRVRYRAMAGKPSKKPRHRASKAAAK